MSESLLLPAASATAACSSVGAKPSLLILLTLFSSSCQCQIYYQYCQRPIGQINPPGNSFRSLFGHGSTRSSVMTRGSPSAVKPNLAMQAPLLMNSPTARLLA